MKKAGLHLYEQFCLPTDVEAVPSDFVTMLGILTDHPAKDKKERKALLLDAIRQKSSEYITVLLSDKTRSRWLSFGGLICRRGHYSNRLLTVNRYLTSEKRLLRELQKSVRLMPEDSA